MSLVISKVFTYDTDAGNYIQAVEGPAGDNQALEPAVRQAINNFVVGCKQDGIWSAIKASCILAGARTLNGALVPLVGTAPTNSGLSGYNRKTGLAGNASNSLNSNYVIPSGNQNNAHGAVWVSTAGNVNSLYFGVSDGGSFGMYPLNTGMVASCNSATASVVTAAGIGTATGLWGINRNAPANYNYKTGPFSASLSSTSATPSTNAVRVFSGNGVFFTTARIAFYSIGEAIDLAKLDSRVTDLIAAFNNPLVIP